MRNISTTTKSTPDTIRISVTLSMGILLVLSVVEVFSEGLCHDDGGRSQGDEKQ
jgi:hypothetical protein